ncbi:MAG: hypothetical protein ACXV2B_07615 [Halobacteriota archaeon]
MDTTTLIEEVKELIGVELPSSTLNGWARKGLVSRARTGRKGGGRGADWPSEAIEQAAVIYTLRAMDLPQGTTIRGCPTATGRKATVSTKRLLQVKEMVERWYATFFRVPFHYGSFIDTISDLSKYVEKLNGYMYGGYENQPIFYAWIATLEKIRHGKPLSETVKVRFAVTGYLDTYGTSRYRFDAISLEPCAENTAFYSCRAAPEVVKQLLGRDPIDWEAEEREGRVIHPTGLPGQKLPTTQVNTDVEKQQITVSDPFQTQLVPVDGVERRVQVRDVVIDLKSGGLKLLSSEQAADIKRSAKRTGECIKKLRELGCVLRLLPDEQYTGGLDWVINYGV